MEAITERLDIGVVLGRTFTTYRDQFGLLVGAALAIFVPIAIISGLILASGAFALLIVAILLAIVGGFWYQGMVVEAARDIIDGRRDHTVGSLFASVTPVIGTLVVAGLLAGIAIAVGLVLLIVPGLILRTIWAVLAPSIVIERKGVFAAFGRSLELVKSNLLQVFGVIVVIFLIEIVVQLIVRAIEGAIDSAVVYVVLEAVRNVLVAPIGGLAAAIMFFELKRLHGEPVLAQAQEAAAVRAEGAASTPPQPGPPPQPARGGPEVPAPPHRQGPPRS